VQPVGGFGAKQPGMGSRLAPREAGHAPESALPRAEWQRLKPAWAARLAVLKPFDPWSSPLCTCPPKLSLDLYSGCGYECLYCYVSAYHPRGWGWARVRPKQDLLRRLRRDLERLFTAAEMRPLRGLPVSVSNSSDPYPSASQADEAALGLTRAAVQMLAEARVPLLVVTKSPLVVRDLELLGRTPAVLSMTITTLDEAIAERLEPYAPPPRARLEALAAAARAGVATACRIDPLIPGLNDDGAMLARLCEALARAGVRRIISSTYKQRPDSWRRLTRVFPHVAARLQGLWDIRQRPSGYLYLSAGLRAELLGRLRELAHEHGLSFTVCREGLAGLSDGVCDGRDLLGGGA
jgi:DNA repair photolyase